MRRVLSGHRWTSSDGSYGRTRLDQGIKAIGIPLTGGAVLVQCSQAGNHRASCSPIEADR